MARKRALDVDEAPTLIVDVPESEVCRFCGGGLHSGARGRRSLWRLDGPLIVISVRRRCKDRGCPGWRDYHHPRAELDRLALRTGDFGLDVVLRIGSLRYLERMSVPEIHRALSRQHPLLKVSERQVTRLLEDYDALAQASLLPKASLKEALGGRTTVTVSLDGLQPDQGKDMLWLVRDLATGLPLASLTHPSVAHGELVALLRQVTDRGLTINGVVSDGQECVLKAIAEALPGVPHQVCQAHFLRNVARPLLDRDAELRAELKKGRAASARSSAPSSCRQATTIPAVSTSRPSLRALRTQLRPREP